METEAVEKYKCLICPESDHYSAPSCLEDVSTRFYKTARSVEYKCTYCSYRNNIKVQLNKHVLIHKCIDVIEKATLTLNNHNSNVLTFNQSQERLSDKKALRLFDELKTKLRSHQCPKCSFWAKKGYLLKDHVIKHRYKFKKRLNCSLKLTKTGTYKCPLCNFNTRNIKKHILKHQFGPQRSSKKTCRCPNFGCRFGGLTTAKEKLQIKKPVYVKMEIEDYCQTLTENSLTDHTYVQRKCKILVKCWICNYQTSRKYCLKKHMRIHKESSNITTFRCYLCKEQQQFKTKILNLIRQLPSNTQCFLCSYETEHSEELQEHLFAHLNSDGVPIQKLYSCLLCEFKTYDLKSLKEHVFTHVQNTSILMYRCEKCDYITNWQYMLSRHESSHLTEKPVDLPQPKKRKSSTRKFWKPSTVVTKQEEIETIDLDADTEDNKTEFTNNSLETSVESTSADSLMSVLLKQTHEDFMLACENKNIVELRCQHCTFFAATDEELADHMFNHLETKEVLKCPSCDFSTNRTDFFKQHKIKHIIKYVCPVCHEEYKRYGKFMCHLRHHKDFNSGEYYTCVYCDYTKPSLDEFKLHVLEHIKDDLELRCFKCYSSFNSRKVLINHLAFHARSKTFNTFVGAVYDSPLLK